MALINCIECGTEISDAARSCPKCGAPASASVKAMRQNVKAANKARRDAEWKARPWWQKLLGYLIVFIAFMLLARACGVIPGGDSKPEPDVVRARWACQSYLRSHADDPDSLEFINQQAAPSVIQKDGSYRVTMTLRANNRFGAKILTLMQCTVVKQSDGFEVASTQQITD